MAQCGTMIEGNVVAFSCDLPPNHDGPHRAYENARSVRERNRWEADKQAAIEGTATLETFQGRPQTTAERYTENPTPVPMTRQQQQEQRRLRVTEMAGDRPEIEADLQARPPDAAGLAETDEDLDVPPEFEQPVVFTSGADGNEFRQASPAEAKVAGFVHDTNWDHAAIAAEREGMEPEPSRQARVTARVCPSCKGAGVWEDDGAGGPCGRCDGTGTIPEPTKQREGDQPLPVPNQGEYVQERIIGKIERLRPQIGDEAADLLIAQMEESMRVGTQRYGTPLQTFNGRDCLQDAIDESRDLNVYLNSMQQAREAQRPVLVNVASQAMESLVPDDMLNEHQRAGIRRYAEVAVDAILRATGGLGGGLST